MIPNRLKELWAEGKPDHQWLAARSETPSPPRSWPRRAMTSSPSTSSTARSTIRSLLPMLQAMRASGVVPMARVPWLEPGIIMKALDAGAYGIICPMVNTRREAAEFVSYMRYPPLGQRSFGPTRVSFAAGADYGAQPTTRCWPSP